MMVSHTPGPWRVVPNPMRADGWFVVRDRRPDERENYAGELPPAICGFQLPLADAKLIAAAPELLEALKAALPFIDDADDVQQLFPESAASVACRAAVVAVRAALAKAEGTPITESAQPCGCDPGANWICEAHRQDAEATR